MQFEHITTDGPLREYCHQLADAAVIAFDTEFISEDTYQPELCLIQVSAEGKLAVIDPLAGLDVTPFWEQLTTEGHETVVHAGREEFRFCYRAIGKRPCLWFDVQLAAGMVGVEYPASYGNLVAKLTGNRLPKGETRTDWRHRPLSGRQLEYALHDVVHLEAIHARLRGKLDERGRLPWLQSELEAWQDEIEREENVERWRRVSGISGLSTRSLAIVRELWRWRDAEAERRNIPPKRVLRDDLIIELARRGTADRKRIRAVRGLQRKNLIKKTSEISQCIQQALQLPTSDLPKMVRKNVTSRVNVMAQFLATALASISRSQDIAPSLVGTVQDLRDLVAHRLQLTPQDSDSLPALAEGWRAEVVGKYLDDLLLGRLAIRITDPLSEHPLSFETVQDRE